MFPRKSYGRRTGGFPRDIDQYEDFCAGHPNYENNRAAATISHLKKVYKDHIRNNDFLI